MASSDDFSDFLSGPRPADVGAGTAVPVPNPSAPSAAAPTGSAPTGQPGFWSEVGAGLKQGAVTIPAQTVTGWLGMTNANRALAQQAAASQQQYGASIPYTIAKGAGEMGTSALATAPIMAALPEEAIGAVGALAGRYGAPILLNAVRGGIAGGATNALMSPDQNPVQAAETGAVGGAVLGGAGGAIGARLAASPTVQAAAQRLGIDLSAGQAAGGLPKWIEDATGMVPGSGARSFNQQQMQQITRVIGREAGMGDNVTQITAPGLEAARQDIGSSIGRIASHFDVPYDAGLDADLANITSNAEMAGPNTAQANVTRNLVSQIQNLATAPGRTGGPGMSGQDFATFISKGSTLDRALNWGGENPVLVKEAAGDIRQALIDAAERSPNTAPDDISALSNARYNYKVIKTIEPAINKTPEGTDEMSLPGLAQQIRRGNYYQGSPMHDLQQLLGGPLAALRSSGTAERGQTLRMLGVGGAEMGGIPAALVAMGHPGWAIPAGGAAYGANALLGRAMRFGPGMNIPVWSQFQRATNPLLPRAAGPWAGNYLVGQPQQASPP